jgi:hypothetical protein
MVSEAKLPEADTIAATARIAVIFDERRIGNTLPNYKSASFDVRCFN